MRLGNIGLVAAAALGASLVTGGDGVRVSRKPPRQRTTEHKHSREIARRLRQQARADAKARGESV